MDETSILKRIDELLALTPANAHIRANTLANEMVQDTITIITHLYGSDSPQMNSFRATVDARQKGAHGISHLMMELLESVKGVLRSIKSQIEGGLIGSLRKQITADVLSDFIKLSREALDKNTEGSKNVAAVLAAAGFEDTLRRIGERFAGITGREDLSNVLIQLKNSGIIQSPQIGIAQSFLTFRNRAMHANWSDIEREAVQSCLSFTQELLLKHFQ